MSYLVAMLLLYTEPCYAFIALANRLEHSLLLCLFRMQHDQIALYWEVYDQLLQDSLPDLHRMFSDEGVTPHQYLMDWFFTVFSRTVPLACSSVLWDNWIYHGDIFLFRAAIGLLKHVSPRLMGGGDIDFGQISWTLKNLGILDADTDIVIKTILSVDIDEKRYNALCAEKGISPGAVCVADGGDKVGSPGTK